MGHRHSSPIPATWQEGYYKCNGIFFERIADMVLVEDNTVHMLGFGPSKLTAGEFGKISIYV